jgi:hypothetical protein
MHHLRHSVARHHAARSLVYVIFVIAVAAGFGLPAEVVSMGGLAAGGVLLVGGPALARIGFKEPDHRQPRVTRSRGTLPVN